MPIMNPFDPNGGIPRFVPGDDMPQQAATMPKFAVAAQPPVQSLPMPTQAQAPVDYMLPFAAPGGGSRAAGVVMPDASQMKPAFFNNLPAFAAAQQVPAGPKEDPNKPIDYKPMRPAYAAKDDPSVPLPVLLKMAQAQYYMGAHPRSASDQVTNALANDWMKHLNMATAKGDQKGVEAARSGLMGLINKNVGSLQEMMAMRSGAQQQALPAMDDNSIY